MLKGQDILVLAVLIGTEETLPYLEIAEKAQISVSEAHAAVKRLQASSLLNTDRRIIRHNAEEFLVHGLRYTFPLRTVSAWSVGMPTAYAAPVAEDAFAIVGHCPVWCGSEGTVSGVGIEPIYVSAPRAARRDQGLYDRLALIDMLRGGRVRERRYAEEKIKGMLV